MILAILQSLVYPLKLITLTVLVILGSVLITKAIFKLLVAPIKILMNIF